MSKGVRDERSLGIFDGMRYDVATGDGKQGPSKSIENNIVGDYIRVGLTYFYVYEIPFG